MRRTALAEKKSNANATSAKARKRPARATHGFAVGVNNGQYPAALELHKIYPVLPDADAAKDGDLRIIDESGEDYLYPADWLVAIRLPQKLKASLRAARQPNN